MLPLRPARHRSVWDASARAWPAVAPLDVNRTASPVHSATRPPAAHAGKTLTAQALLRSVHSAIAAGTFLPGPGPPRAQPPALVSINCMRLSAAGQVAARILVGLAAARSAEHIARVSGERLTGVHAASCDGAPVTRAARGGGS